MGGPVLALDLKRGWDADDQAAQKTDDPRHKAILEQMKDHLKWEVLGRPDKVPETVAPDGIYQFYGLGSSIELGNFDEIRAFYQGMVDDGTNVLQLDIDHLAVADWGLSAHGTWRRGWGWPAPGAWRRAARASFCSTCRRRRASRSRPRSGPGSSRVT